MSNLSRRDRPEKGNSYGIKIVGTAWALAVAWVRLEVALLDGSDVLVILLTSILDLRGCNIWLVFMIAPQIYNLHLARRLWKCRLGRHGIQPIDRLILLALAGLASAKALHRYSICFFVNLNMIWFEYHFACIKRNRP